jgi:ketosteroid isomerase-like protein
MSELDDFRTTALARQVEAENALYNGDPALLIEMWSTQHPVTLFGAWGPFKSGWEEVSRVTRRFASRLSLVSDHRFELVAAGVSGDLAYTVGYERYTASIDGGPVQPTALRVTHIYRRENGSWKIAHRHSDVVPADQSPPAQAAATH